MSKEKYNGMHVPDIQKVDMEQVQKIYCNTSNKCTDFCQDCVFDPSNLNEFKTWINSHLKTDIHDK